MNNIPVLNGTNFKKWKEHIMIVLGYMDLDYAMRFDRPANLNETSLNEQKSANEKWEQSNCMSSMMMQHSIPKSLKGSLTENKNVKGFLKEITDQFAAIEKVETSTILNKIVSMSIREKET
ncbi:hypothetical protein T459_27273 [Capsicum annuum]|uniref:Retrotransposon Copia-like N-terminal domain-containing protein n=1 Tax=Capsicum annuum TaxID=4072 RepID=A0A1U8ERG1_CAPAN|nr:hypothetical protein T459_27273 [Capsicum annuum]